MARKTQKELDFARLRRSVAKAAALAGAEFGEDGLVSYLQHQALKKPNAFMALLLKVASAELDEQANETNNITRIELVAPLSQRKDEEE